MNSLKVLYFTLLAIICTLCISSCNDDNDNNPINGIEKSYFTIDKAAYNKSPMPTSTMEEAIDGISLNNTAITGGVSVMSIITTQNYKNFYFAVKGVEGHYTLNANDVRSNDLRNSTNESGFNTYVIPLVFSMEYSTNFNIEIIAETADGDFTDTYEETINYIETKTGNLHVSLSFTSLKDVDLHLITPSKIRIFYGNRNISTTLPDGTVASAHLDLDSNAGCHIDGVNKENIYLDSYFIESGTYEVYVDMYANCDPSVVTHYSVVAMDNNGIITNKMGSNPVTGMFPANQSSGNMLKVMEFVINESPSTSVSKPDWDKATYEKITEYAKIKLLSSGFDSKE